MGKKRQIFLLEEFQIIYVIDLALKEVESDFPCALSLDALNDFLAKNRVWKDVGKSNFTVESFDQNYLGQRSKVNIISYELY